MTKKSVYADNVLKKDNPNDAWAKLFDLVPQGSSILDIGCSSGNFGAELIANKSCKVTGIDINDVDVGLAKKQLTKAIVRNIEQEEISDLGTFDVVIMADVIEHLIDPVPVLVKVRKALKPGGVFVFSVPNMANMATRIELLKGRFEYTKFGLLDQTHLHYYDKVELEKVLSAAGFKVENYNNTIRDIPKVVVESELKSIGLTSSPKFIEHVKHPDAIAFQFIGKATPSSAGAHAKLTSKTPHDFMSQFIDDLNARHEEDTKQLRKELKSTRDQLQKASQREKQIKAELDSIYRSKGWKLLSTVYTTKKHTVGRVSKKHSK